MPELHVLRVFCNEEGGAGNPLGVFLDGGAIAPGDRQGVAAQLGFSETVFVEDAASGRIRIHTPAVELDFAGHPAVGTAWLIAQERAPVDMLQTLAGEVGARMAGDEAFVTADAGWGPPWEWDQLESPAVVDALEGPLEGRDLVGYWAWLDEAAGIVRARVFPVRLGIPEDEATGSAALVLCAQLDRPLQIRQGEGSVMSVRPGPGLSVELGGRVALDERRSF